MNVFWRKQSCFLMFRMAPNYQLGFVVLYSILSSTSAVDGPAHRNLNECERGVKRHHPSQANLYQVFTRKFYRKQWLDFECDEYMIFDPRTCACVESWVSRGEYERATTPEAETSHNFNVEKVQERVRETHEDERGPARAADDQPSSKSSEELGRGREPLRRGAPPDERMAEEKNFPEPHEVWNRNWDSRDSSERMTEKDYDEEEEINCYLHRSTPSSASHFERWTDGRWVEEDCNWPFYTGLIWSQEACRCEWGPNRTLAKPQLENSIPAACLMMLRMTFDKGQIKDEGRGIWLKLINKEEAAVEYDKTAVGGYAGSFRGASIEVPYFKSNVLGTIFHIGLMFKLCPGEPDTGINIVHNMCEESREGPSLVVSYQSWKQQVTVAMRTTESLEIVEDYCVMRAIDSKNDWIQLDIRYQDNYLEVTANGEVCLESDKYYGPLATNNCPLTLLGDSFCGLLDEVIVTRGCTSAHAVS